MTPAQAAELLAMLGPVVGRDSVGAAERRSELQLMLNCALGMCLPGPQALLRVHYVADEGYRPELVRLLLVDMSRWHRKADGTPKGYMRSLCEMAVSEYVAPLKCPACRGTGMDWKREGDALVETLCQTCFGSRRMAPPPEAYAAVMDVEQETWDAVHAPRYDRLSATLRRWDREGLMTVCDQMKEAA